MAARRAGAVAAKQQGGEQAEPGNVCALAVADPEGKAVAAASKAFYDELRRLDVEFAKNSNAMNKNSIPYNVMDPDSTAVSILI